MSLATALILVRVLFGFTVVGGLGLLLTASSYDALDGRALGVIAYGALPGTLGWLLARRAHDGGRTVWVQLLAVQAWLILTAIANLADGSSRGGLQLLLPVLVLVFLLLPESREWFTLPGLERAERRPFSLARMMRPHRDGGQTAVEYAALVAVVAAIIGALVVSGLGTQIYGGIRAEVCKVTGSACPAPAGTATDVTAGDTTGGASGTTGGETGGSTAGTTGGSNSGTSGSSTTTSGTTSDTTGGDKDKQKDADKDADKGDDSDDDSDDDKGCFSGVGAFFGCAGNQVKQVAQGVGVDGIWGDVTGIYDLVRHPLDTVKGLGDYGKQLGSDWLENSKDAGKKWSDGHYWDALTDWGGASLKTGGTVLFDMFVGDDVVDQWNNGQKTRAVSHVLWNVGSLFIPGYDAGKVVKEVGALGKLGKLGKLAEKAAEAAEDAKRAAKAGDVEGAERAAKKADDAAAEAEDEARKAGCTIGAPVRRVPWGGGAGTGHTLLAAGGEPYVVLAEDGCDEDAEEAAEKARQEADEADHAAGRLTDAEAEAARKPTVSQGDPKKFKDHFLRHKKLVEDALGTKYKKLKEDGPRFLQDIQDNIANGTFKLVGKGTLKKGEPAGLIYRGNGVTIVLRENGEFWTALKTGEGLDTSIEITQRAP